MSGGVDSSYVAYYVKEILGLRPLALHLDNGWNDELAVHNIEKILRKLNIDLWTEVLDWDEFRSLQLSFLKHPCLIVKYPLIMQLQLHYTIRQENLTSNTF